MAWQEEWTILLREYVNDTSATPRYSDDRLEQALVVGARLVLTELPFPTAFVADVVNITITPDPTATATRDDNFSNLAIAKTACIIDRGGASSAADQAIRVKDGASEVDLRAVFAAKQALLNKGWCAYYAEMKQEYQLSQQGTVVGAAIFTPFRLYAGLGGGAHGATRRPY